MVDKAPENKDLNSLVEALDLLHSLIPQDLRDRQFIGNYWEQIYAMGDIPLETVITTDIGILKVKTLLAANVINVALQNWLSEAAM